VSTWGIVVAAGRGDRFGRPKHLLALAGITMWERARDALLAGGVDGVVVVGDVPGGVAGGERRRDSVEAGVARLPADAEYVLVHDAARPLASGVLAARVLTELRSGEADAVVPVVAVRDTLKRVTGRVVESTLDRTGLVAVQTPQGFRVDVLRRAQAADAADASDEAVLVERTGGTVVVVEGEVENLKVTYPGDLKVAEALLS
jgi:2-C-methyl-D-erythritol 4-phosphate cytidylyltransferase